MRPALAFLLLSGFALSAHAELRAGAARLTLTPDLNVYSPVWMAGFGSGRKATGTHDDLWVRCVAFATGDRPIAVCEADLIGLFVDDTDRVRAHFPKADVIIASTHAHEGPDTMGLWGERSGVSGINNAYQAYVTDRITDAAGKALDSLEPARVRFASVKTAELDTFISDNRPPDRHDSELIVMAFESTAGKPIATVVNWANHPETLADKNTLITADYPFYLCNELETRMGGVGVLWNGAVGGMQSTLGTKVKDPATGELAPDHSFRKAEVIGRRVAELAATAVKAEKPVAVDGSLYKEKRIPIPMANAGFQMALQAGVFKGRKQPNAEGAADVPVGLLRLTSGKTPVLEVALIPGEMYPELSVGGVERYSGADYPDAPVEPAIKEQMTARYRMLIGLANDEIGYIIPKAEWDEKAPYLNGSPKKFYGEVNSMGPETAPRIAAAFQELARAKQ